MDWGIFIATIIGPVIAVIITLWYQNNDRTYQRRLTIFSTMMRMRRHMLSTEFVGALNLVPVDFSDKKLVMDRYGELFTIFQDSGWESGKPEVIGSLHEQSYAKVAELLSEMAKVLSIKIDQMRILRAAYHPRGWADEEQQARTGREQMIKVLRGEVPLPIVVFNGQGDDGQHREGQD